MEVDEALSKLGSVGKWQVVYFIVLSFAVMFPTAFHMVAVVYIGYRPPHHCKLNDGAVANESIPFDRVKGALDSCKMFVNASHGREEVDCVNGWQYLGDDGPTIVTKWDLVCDRAYLAQSSQTILVVGVMVGAICFTALSDYFGRKPIFLLSQWLMVLVGIGTALSPNIYFFFVMRFLTGALQQGILLTGFVMACELFAAKYRTFAGTIIENFWAVAWCVAPLLAWLFRNWQTFQVFISLIGVLTIPLFWFLPESVPWLCANGRIKDAERVIRNAATMNGITMPDQILSRPSTDGKHVEGDDKKKENFLSKLNFLKKKKIESDDDTEPKARYTIIDLLKNKKLTLYAVVMSILWMVVTLVYYGLSLSTALLAGNRYLNGFLNAVVEIPAYTSSYFAMKRFGRRYPLIAYHMIAGVALLANAYFDRPESGFRESLEIPIIIFNMLGKFGITGSFGIVFLYAPEIFPTTLRNQALGIASLFGRVGNTLATFTSFVLEKHSWLPGSVFGFLSIAGGLLVFFLPETLNRPLPQTIEDVEAWSSHPPPKETKSGRESEMKELRTSPEVEA